MFARLNPEGRQFLAFQMSASLSHETALVLPLPVDQQAEDPLRFMDVNSPYLFPHLGEAFGDLNIYPCRSRSAIEPRESVAEVGTFEACYVPTIAEFSQLDPRFQVDASLWRRVPQYADFAFVVLKLQSANKRSNPIALSFASRSPDRLFFPTMQVEPKGASDEAELDATLYCQAGGNGLPVEWTSTTRPFGEALGPDRSLQGLLDPDRGGYRLQLRGLLPNREVVLAVEPVTDPPPWRNPALDWRNAAPSGRRPGLIPKW